MAIASISPTTGKTIQAFRPHPDTVIEQVLESGARTFKEHRGDSFVDRAAKMQRVADFLEVDRERFARIISMEMGKIFRASLEESGEFNKGFANQSSHSHRQRSGGERGRE